MMGGADGERAQVESSGNLRQAFQRVGIFEPENRNFYPNPNDKKGYVYEFKEFSGETSAR